ncbi:MAG: ABC transporter permease [Planctomycetota bacterium JB042]
MRILELTRDIRLGVKTLMLHKLRSMLTMLGVVFGTGSVVAMLAVGEGASEDALERIRKLGSNNLILTAQKSAEDDQPGAVRRRMSIYGLTYEDEQRIRTSFESVVRTVPVKQVRKEGRLGERQLELRVVGTTVDWFDLVRRPVLAGRTLRSFDMDGSTNSVVLTEHGARRLLANENVVGQSIKIGGLYFEVVGIVRNETSAEGVQVPDESIDAYIPLAVARTRYGDMSRRRTAGSDEREMVELHQIIVEVRDTDEVQATAAAIERMLERFHKSKDYAIEVPLALLRSAEETKRRFNIVLGSIAGISLLVGGIGIMNIMLASVTERTREIGIRRAIGARKGQIVRQFLIETTVLSSAGGLAGIGVGVLIPRLIERFADMPTIVTPFSILLSAGIGLAIGMIFGIYPAVRAANLDPIVALRHE